MWDRTFWEGKRVLVGGGCGFLGSYLIPELVEAGSRILVVDDLSNATVAPESLSSRVDFLAGDLSDQATAVKATAGQDIVLNLAARAYGMAYSRSHNGEMLVHNLLCTLVPLEAARRNGVERLLVMSSSCVYPDDAPVPTPELDVFTGAPESVNEGYGWAKRIQELAGVYYAGEHGMKITVVRPFNPYGANYRWGTEEKAHVIPALVKRVMDGDDPVVVWGSGDQERNFLHAGDAARLIMMIVERDLVGVPVNIGYEETVTIRELVRSICEAASVTPRVVFDTSQPEGRFRKSADSSRLQEFTTDYLPKVSLQEGIVEMLEWYKRSFE